MKILIIGATGGTGRALVEQALAQGHNVSVLVRNPEKIRTANKRLTVIQGDILDHNSVDRAVAGKDAVLSTLGHKRWIIKTTILSTGTKNIITAMEKHDVRLFICETSLGVGDSRGRLGLYYTLFVIPFILYFYFKDKERQERLITESSLEWVIVRPAQLTNGPVRGLYRHGQAVGSYIFTQRISRADVAEFMLKQLIDTSHRHQAVALAY